MQGTVRLRVRVLNLVARLLLLLNLVHVDLALGGTCIFKLDVKGLNT